MNSSLDDVISAGLSALASTNDPIELENIKARYVGKSGALTEFLKQLASLSPEEKRTQGAAVNQAKQSFESALQGRRDAIAAEKLAKQLEADALDVTLPGRGELAGGLHPVTLVRERIVALFESIGFEVADGPEIETDWHNFAALNIPKDHPARAMQDTFYVEAADGEEAQVLRTHTSPIQVRYMLDNPPPIKIIAPGRVYRVDSDATHSPMFHQIEGLFVDQRVSMGDLKATLDYFFREFFGDASKTRFRPSYFPFTEPSAEVDVSCIFCQGAGCKVCKGSGWLEVGGAGLVHPEVFKRCGFDSSKVQGWAFGLGVERLAMLKLGISDLRFFFENRVSFLRKGAS